MQRKQRCRAKDLWSAKPERVPVGKELKSFEVQPEVHFEHVESSRDSDTKVDLGEIEVACQLVESVGVACHIETVDRPQGAWRSVVAETA